MSVYDTVEIEDMTYDPVTELLYYPCPCGDRFQVSIADLLDGETNIATCPSCSLTIEIVFEKEDLESIMEEHPAEVAVAA